MKLKYCLIAATVAASAAAMPARAADVGISIGIGVPMAPPPVIYQAPPPAPAMGYVWVPGYWAWNYDRYIWIGGRYVYGRPGYVWRPDRWEQRGPHWHHVRGYWKPGHQDRGRHRGHRD